MSVNKEVPVQLHYQLTNTLREFIQKGQWSIGDMFPPDREIMSKYNVSATTVRRAVTQLVKEGWLERKPGKGTFIIKEPLREDLVRLTGFFEEMYNQGQQPSADILFKGAVTINATLLKQFRALKALQTTELVLLEKVHKVNDQPLFYVKSFWLPEYGEEFLKFDLTSRGVYDIAAKHLGLFLSKADETIYAGAASEKEARFLKAKRGFPVLIMERIIYAGERAVEFSYNVCRADRYRYHVVRFPKELAPAEPPDKIRIN